MTIKFNTSETDLFGYAVQTYPRGNVGSSPLIFQTTSAGVYSETWIVSIATFNTSVSRGEYLVLNINLYKSKTDFNSVAESGFFNVTVPNTKASATISTSAAASSPTKAVPSTIPTTETASSPTSTTSPSSSGGLSTGIVAGIAVGSTIGGILVLAGLGFIIWKRFRKGGSNKPTKSRPDNYEGSSSAYSHSSHNPMQHVQTVHELHAPYGQQTIAELPSSPRRK
ncbi:hypothetical protein QQS21_001438 [Conoideocrella luteorostrata]|uniref:Mid2 domain-containing protein n=1 Tax=Conoideocrella luteorostrata TaxID=1105319 RepID=A0AAJ0CZS9_9HYPO|nr:hypothetical protein QQS21_001438 [Conoideocrella luteorostrata]